MVGTGRGFCVGSLAGGGRGSFEAGGARLESPTEDSVDGFEGTGETPGDGAGSCDDAGLRAGTSPGGKGMEANFEGEL